MQTDDQISNFLSYYCSDVYNLANLLQGYLLKNLPDINVEVDEKAKIIAFGYGHGYKNNICNILVSKSSVKLGFYRGAELPDPDKILTGSGKVHKYVEIKSEKDIHSPSLNMLLAESLKSYSKRRTKNK